MNSHLNGNDISSLPKIDLHVHLDGSLRPQTVLDLAESHGVLLPTTDKHALLSYMQVNEDCSSLQDYLSKFHFTTRFLQTAVALERVAFEIVEKANRHHCKYIEIRFAPQLHRERGLYTEEVIHYVLAGLKRGEQQFGVRARGIAICMRHHDHQQNMEVIHAASKYIGKGLVAVDLAGDEASYPPELFREIFAASHRRDIPVTIHAGEAAGAANIHEAVSNLGATRIGHGVRLQEAPAIMDMMIARQIPLEMCPVSNIQTKAVSNWESYPIRNYFERGLMITVNTDNPGVSGTSMTKEYRILAERFGFTPSELGKIAMNGAHAAFLEESEKAKLKRELREEFANLGISV